MCLSVYEYVATNVIIPLVIYVTFFMILFLFKFPFFIIVLYNGYNWPDHLHTNNKQFY